MCRGWVGAWIESGAPTSSSFAADTRKSVTYFINIVGDMYNAADKLPTTIAAIEISAE
ncbi:MAG: hypothetical protein IH987_11115 [Planctomycetes bacterium]|nr:hypothetical protein [Planctomycetota bacterium]